METKEIVVGDQILVSLAELGDFTATAHKITDKGVLFIFDDYVTSRPMNNKNTNKGGYEKSDLKKWIDCVLLEAFPEELKNRIADLSIPTVGELFGHDDEWNNEHFEPDTDEQLLLMKERRNRVAYLNNEWEWGWLRNPQKRSFLRLISLMWPALAMRPTTTLLPLLGFVRSSGWLGKSRGLVPHLKGETYGKIFNGVTEIIPNNSNCFRNCRRCWNNSNGN